MSEMDDDVAKQQLLDWVNATFTQSHTKLEQAFSCAFYCQIIDMIHPGVIPINKVKFNTKLMTDYLSNYKLLVQGMNKVGITKKLDLDKIIKLKFPENFELLQFLKAYYEDKKKEEVVTVPTQEEVNENGNNANEEAHKKEDIKNEILQLRTEKRKTLLLEQQEKNEASVKKKSVFGVHNDNTSNNLIRKKSTLAGVEGGVGQTTNTTRLSSSKASLKEEKEKEIKSKTSILNKKKSIMVVSAEKEKEKKDKDEENKVPEKSKDLKNSLQSIESGHKVDDFVVAKKSSILKNNSRFSDFKNETAAQESGQNGIPANSILSEVLNQQSKVLKKLEETNTNSTIIEHGQSVDTSAASAVPVVQNKRFADKLNKLGKLRSAERNSISSDPGTAINLDKDKDKGKEKERPTERNSLFSKHDQVDVVDNDSHSDEIIRIKKENEELKDKVASMEITVEQAKKESTYYYSKLQKLDILKQEKYKGMKSEELLKIINDIIYH